MPSAPTTDGNVEIQGGRGLDLSSIFAARKVLATVEETVPAGTFQTGTAPRSFILPRSFVTGIAQAPFGAYPTSCLPYYPTDYRELLRLTGSDRLEIEPPDHGATNVPVRGSPLHRRASDRADLAQASRRRGRAR